MAINRARLEAQLEQLKLNGAHLREQYIAIKGAISNLEFLLDEDTKASKEPEKDKV